MGLLDRFRRRRADAVVPPLWTAMSLDGGWRDVAPITPVLRSTDPTLAPGLPFRDGLASWRNVTFGTPMGHAVGPSAPAGTMQGVIRYRTPGPGLRPGGGRLLLLSRAADTVPEEPRRAAVPVVARRPPVHEHGATPPVRSVPAIRSTTDRGAARSGDPAPTVAHQRAEPVVRRATDHRAPRPLPDGPVPVRQGAEPTTAQLSRTPRPRSTRSGIGEPLPSMPTTAILPSATPSPPSSPTAGPARPGPPTGDVALPVFRSVAGDRPLVPTAGAAARATVTTGPTSPDEHRSPRAQDTPLPVTRTVASTSTGRAPSPGAGAGSAADIPVSERPLLGPRTHATVTEGAAAPDEHRSPSATAAGLLAGTTEKRPLPGSAASAVPPGAGSAADIPVSGERPLLGSTAGASAHATATEGPASSGVLPSPAPDDVALTVARAATIAPLSGQWPSSPAGASPTDSAPTGFPAVAGTSVSGARPPLGGDVPRPTSRAVAAGSSDPPPGDSAPATVSAPSRSVDGDASRSGARSPSDSPAGGMRGAAGTSPSTFETAAAARLPVVQRSAADFLGPTTQPVTRPARAAGAGPAPGVPAYRIAPLLSAPRLAGPVMASRSAPDRVAPAVWRRPAAPTEGTVRPIAPQSGEPDHGVDIVAMAPARPARAAPPAVLPVTRVQRAQPTAGPSRTNSTSAPPVLSPAPTVSTAVQRPPETTRSPQDSPPRPDPLDGIEMDRLARMLFEPISRLLRADLRRGRERAGAGHDHRR